MFLYYVNSDNEKRICLIDNTWQTLLQALNSVKTGNSLAAHVFLSHNDPGFFKRGIKKSHTAWSTFELRIDTITLSFSFLS